MLQENCGSDSPFGYSVAGDASDRTEDDQSSAAVASPRASASTSERGIVTVVSGMCAMVVVISKAPISGGAEADSARATRLIASVSRRYLSFSISTLTTPFVIEIPSTTSCCSSIDRRIFASVSGSQFWFGIVVATTCAAAATGFADSGAEHVSSGFQSDDTSTMFVKSTAP